ncbi:MAG: dihydrofolate reductase family protein [Caldilineaceae bacterium]
MSDEILQLYPQPAQRHALHGLYLQHNLRALATGRSRPYVYTDYVTSIDGRIAVPHPTKPGLTVPKQVANDRDWRLFQELAVQADVIITSGRYLRDYADGRAQEILNVYDDPAFADLRDWRAAHELPPYPDLVVISASLDFPVPPALTAEGRKVIIATIEAANPARVDALRDQAAHVIIAGELSVQGATLIQALDEFGYRLVYNTTGPKVMHLLLADQVLDRLYVTFAQRLLGGAPFAAIVDGPLLEPPVDLTLNTLYLDTVGFHGVGQMFVSYDCGAAAG